MVKSIQTRVSDLEARHASAPRSTRGVRQAVFAPYYGRDGFALELLAPPKPGTKSPGIGVMALRAKLRGLAPSAQLALAEKYGYRVVRNRIPDKHRSGHE